MNTKTDYMKRILLTILLFGCAAMLHSQNRYDVLPVHHGGTVIAGDSITDDCEWNELFGDQNILNRGIDGNTTQTLLERVGELVRHHPEKLFLAIGSNDDLFAIPQEQSIENMKKIFDAFEEGSPETRIFVESILPCGPEPMFAAIDSKVKNEAIRSLNKAFKALCEERGHVFIDTYSHFLGEDGENIAPEVTSDNLHLSGRGYQLWRTILMPYIFSDGLQAKAPVPGETAMEEMPSPQLSGTTQFEKAFGAGKIRRQQVFSIMDTKPRAIIFAGGSIMEDCEWKELFCNDLIINRGIDGETISELVARLPEMTRHNPRKVFIEPEMGETMEESLEGIRTSIRAFRKSGRRRTKVYVLSALPTREGFAATAMGGTAPDNATVKEYNARLRKLCRRNRARYIDLYDTFLAEDGEFDTTLGTASFKLSVEGYSRLGNRLKRFVR